VFLRDEKKLGLQQIPKNLLTNDLKALLKPGEIWYAPDSMMETFKNFAKLESYRNSEGNQ